ncbi:MAG: histidine ammonia-lyase [Planctomycetes bacterium]|nr:histidine ammonia-lyase [Planctomycetota bacterium]
MHAQAETTLTLGGGPLSLEMLDPLLEQKLTVTIGEGAWQRVQRSRDIVEQAIADGRVLYGINTGFGHLKSITIPEDQLEQLQENLIRSHAVGVGAPACEQVVRWMILFKLHSLLQAHSGVRRETIELLAGMFNADCLPIVPSKGSLGASGDLAPLAHMTLPMIGEGQVTIPKPRGQGAAGFSLRDSASSPRGLPISERTTLPAKEAFAKLALKPIKLQPKEGLALLNGTQYMSAMAAVCVIRARRLAKHADIIAAMSLEGFRGSAQPFDERLHKIRPHAGAQIVAANMRALLAGSEIMASHADCDRVQDPYSFRCIPQVHGASRDAIEHAAGIVETEINSVTDNPIIFDNGDIISGGNFHGQSLALVMDYMAIALAELASIAERRTYLLLEGRDDLPPMLTKDPGINSGLMMLQYTAAALVNENKVLATPASIDTITTSGGQEDHVSMGATSANKLMTILENAETVLAIEMLCAAQALDFRAPLKPGAGPQAAHKKARERFEFVRSDRVLAIELSSAVEMIRAQELTSSVASAIERLL